MNTMEDVVAKVQQRRLAAGPMIAQMIRVRDRYNGDIAIPLPNSADETSTRPNTASVIANGINNLAVRAGSMTPVIYCPAIDPAKATGRRSVEYARTRRRALGYTWTKSDWELAAYRLYRHLAGYSTAALDVQADMKMGYPCVKVRDPLSTFCEPKAPEDLSPPIDCAFIYAKSRDWLLSAYPETASIIGRSTLGGSSGDTQMWELVEWIDEYDIVIGLLGPQVAYRSQFTEPLRYAMELRRWPNRAGRCTTYIPRQVTMDRIANQIANMVGTVDLMAKLLELDVRATERSIYPDRYIIGKLGQSPQLVGGRWADGASGEVNIIIDAESVGQLHGTPDPHNTQTIDRLERNINLSAGVVPQMGGETYGALRTGRGIDSLLGASVDPRIQEMHVIMQKAMLHANETIIDVWKGYWPTKKVTGFSGWATDRGQVAFTPSEHLETTDNAVLYPIPGADVQTATVILGQVYGMKAMSLDTLRHLHPYVSDPEGEGTQRLVEDIEEALKAALLQRAVSGQIPDVDMAEILTMVKQGSELETAVINQQKAAQARQATQAPPPGPGQAAAPETMPGLANPGMGAEQAAAGTVPPPPVGLDNFRALVGALRRPQQGVGQGVGTQGGG